MKVKVTVMPKRGLLDPQGVAVHDAIKLQGVDQVESVRIGKILEIQTADGNGLTEETLHGLCKDLLSNPVVEDYTFEIVS